MRSLDSLYAVYYALRKVVKGAGLLGPARRLAGPALGRLLFKLASGGGAPFQLNGQAMYLAPAGIYPPLDMAMERYEPGTTRLFEQVVKPGMVVIDIGAHVGYYTLLAAKHVGPTGKVYAFEPERNNHAILVKNIRMNGYDNVVAPQLAVSDQGGSSTLYLSGLDSGRHAMYHHGLPERGSVAVETTTVDSFLECEGWPSVSLIKIDVEGSEVAVLDGMTRLMSKSPDLRLIIEFNPALIRGRPVTPLEFLERLDASGWEIQIIQEADGLLPLAAGDGPALIDQLLVTEMSVNLFCSRT